MVVQMRGQQLKKKKKKNPIKISDDHTVQLHLLVHTQHEQSAVLPLFTSKKKKKKKKRAANIQKTPEPEAGVIKENKCF